MQLTFISRTLLLTILCSSAFASDWTIRGQVFEKGTKRPLSGVQVVVRENDAISDISDDSGHFTLPLPDSGTYNLIATAIGAETPATVGIKLEKGLPPPSPVIYLRTSTVLSEVVVSAARNPNRISKSVLTGTEIKQVAGSSGDPLNALQTLPGVATKSGSAPAVRGSGPGDNAYYVDSLIVGKLFHFGGLSVFNGDLISDFNLYSAAFSPHYGNVTGAVLDVSLRNPRTDRLGAKLNVSLIGADVLLEGPTANNQSFYFAARRSYLDLMIHQVSQKGVTLQIPNYSDYQGKYLWDINDSNRVSLHVNGATDKISLQVDGNSDTAKTQPALAGDIAMSDSANMQAVVWDSKLSGGANNKLALERMSSQMSQSVGSAGSVLIGQNTSLLREKINLPLADDHELSLGTNYAQTTYDLNLDFNNQRCTQFNPNCDLTTAPRMQLVDQVSANAWDVSAQDRKRIVEHVTLVTGLRHSRDDYLNKPYTEPRLGMEWEWSEQTLLTAGWGKHHQLPNAQEIARKIGNPYLDYIEAEHSVLGIARTLDADWSWKAETYYKKLNNLVVSDSVQNYVNGASGKAYGVELLVKKAQTDKLSGWLSLTLAKSERQNDLTGEAFRFQYDQPVNTTLVSTYKISEDWTLSGKWNYHTGSPYTPINGTKGTYADGRPIPNYGGVNSATLPDYHRIDLRLDRNYVFNTWKLNTYFELNNVYQRQNISGYNYGPNYDRKDPVYPLVIPFSFGVQGEF
jgi:hypothetical protein